ncbi:hypothetical protein PTKIN_Ptkin13bG0221800 [Pterospermum kingtungense]
MVYKQGNRSPTSFEDSPIGGDLISELPDDILVSILSLLDSKEAARSSILSCRWRNLWTFTSRLVFDDSLLVRAMLFNKVTKSLEVERCRFINWVNTVLKFYRGTTIDKFTVCFDVDEQSCKLDIERWIIFAFEKKVRSLHLDFRITRGYFLLGSYTLTTEFLSNCTISSLKELRLFAVEVSSEVVEYILSACPLLELLRVQSSESLVWLKLFGPSLNLKTLEIMYCPVEYVEISASNLVSFSYCGNGRRTVFVINNVPHLVEASISGLSSCFLVKNMFLFSGLLSQLETFMLDLTMEVFRKFPKLKNLKHLELVLDGRHAHSLLYCAKFLKVSPLLCRFTLKVNKLDSFPIYRKMKEQETKQPHLQLKVIEFCGFVGSVVDIELLLCLLKRAVSLKKLIIDPRVEYIGFHNGYQYKDPELVLAARTRAKQLETRLPPSAELVIL